jgi:hypothetical protein
MAKRGLAKSMGNDIRKTVVRAAREASVEIMNGLVEAGPGYTGEFSSAWYAVPKGGAAGPPRRPEGGSLYRYDLRNVPAGRFAEGTIFQIVNGHPEAPVIMDLEPGQFIRPDTDPIKSPVAEGDRYGSRRGEVESGEGDAISTAPLDWYPDYSRGGRLQIDLSRGVTRGFRTGGRGFG